MIDFIKNETPIVICDIGASPIEKTNFIDDLSSLIPVSKSTIFSSLLERKNKKTTSFTGFEIAFSTPRA